jgi:hypothetical protein
MPSQAEMFAPEEMGPVSINATKSKASTHKQTGLRSHPKAHRLVTKTN